MNVILWVSPIKWDVFVRFFLFVNTVMYYFSIESFLHRLNIWWSRNATILVVKQATKGPSLFSFNNDQHLEWPNRSFRPQVISPRLLNSFLTHLARFKCNIPRSISHKPKQACFKYNIPRSRKGGYITGPKWLGGKMPGNRPISTFNVTCNMV